MSGADVEQPVIDVRIAEPGPLGLTFAVLKAGDDGPSHDFDLRLITDPTLLKSRDSLADSAFGGLQLDDELWVTGVEADTTLGKRYPCRTVDGAARILLVGDFSLTLLDKSVSRNGVVASHSIGELMDWCVHSSPSPLSTPYSCCAINACGWLTGVCWSGAWGRKCTGKRILSSL